MATPRRFRVVPQEDGSTLAHLLGRRLGGVTPEDAVRLVQAGGVYLGSTRVRMPTMRVATGERVTVYLDALQPEPASLPALRFVYRDPDFVILDKPAGVPVAATQERADHTLAEHLRTTLEREGVARPYVGVVHRLDQGATGLVLFTIRTALNQSLHRMFTEHRIDRRYRIRVHGEAPDELRCTASLVELPHGRGVVVASSHDPRAVTAETRFVRLEPRHPRPGTALLEATLTTGRTHQIRVHAAHSGFPVLGDRRYGPPNAEDTPLHLHAWCLDFAHPRTGEAVHVEAPLPAWALVATDPDAPAA